MPSAKAAADPRFHFWAVGVFFCFCDDEMDVVNSTSRMWCFFLPNNEYYNATYASFQANAFLYALLLSEGARFSMLACSATSIPRIF